MSLLQVASGDSQKSLKPAGHRLLKALVPYVLSALAVGLAVAATLLFDIVAPQAPTMFLLFGAIVAVAWFLGTGPGWLSVALATVSADYFFIPPIHVLELGSKDIPWLIAFVASAAATNAFSLRRRAIEEMSGVIRDELERRVRERTASLQLANDRIAAEMAERSRAEAALRETRNELARAARIAAAAELTASIAHEINQPLAAVVSNGEAALNWLKRTPPAPAKVHDSIVATVAAGERAAEVIRRIRSLIARGAIVQTEVDINDLVRSVMVLAGPELTRRGVVAECRYARRLPLILGDRVQLQQLMLNLVNNAAEAMSDVARGKRMLVVRTLRVDDGDIRIVVEDSGHGLSDADIGRMFDPFYSTKNDGMGMGLSICRTIVESHGGTIRATSRMPTGAHFEVDLPTKAGS